MQGDSVWSIRRSSEPKKRVVQKGRRERKCADRVRRLYILVVRGHFVPNDLALQKYLSREEFSSALKRGHGRAFLHVQNFGLAEVADLVLAACLKNPAYDRQCESSRAPWLFSVFKGREEYPVFASAILSAFRQETDNNDIEHLCELTAQLAIHGDEIAANALRRRVLDQSFVLEGDQFGCNALVLLDGIDAVVELARRFGRSLLESSEERLPFPYHLAGESGLRESADAVLEQLAVSDEAISAFWNSEQSWEREFQTDKVPLRDEERRESSRRELPLEKILADAAAGVGDTSFKYTRFGKYATVDELKVVWLRLINESDEKVCLRLLWVFRAAMLPELHPAIWKLAESDHDKIRAAAITALAQCHDPSVGNFARAALRSARSAKAVSDGMETLVKHYRNEDALLVRSALSGISASDGEAHAIGFSIARMCRENESCDLLEALIWDYENNPCTLCRCGTVSMMSERGVLAPAIISECLHDADPDIRKLAQEAASS
jgi:hypothetical protein